MNGMILEQSTIFLYALVLGSLAVFFYDLMRVLRRVISHKRSVINVEDFIYFVLLGFIGFLFIKEYNSGEVRGYIILAFGIGGISYYLLFSYFVLKYVTLVIQWLVKPIKVIFHYLLLPIRKTVQFLNKNAVIPKKYLKKIVKCSIIKLARCFRELKNIVKYY